jgi:hypothetical protein
VDLYGEMLINNLDRCSCKLTFIKVPSPLPSSSPCPCNYDLISLYIIIQASYWSSKKYIVHGDVYDGDGVKVRHLFGTWHEALFCGEDPDSAQCVWRTGQSNFASK